MKKEKNNHLKFSLVIIVAICFLTVGFAAYSTSLSINELKLKVGADEDLIQLTDLSYVLGTGSASTIANHDDNNISIEITSSSDFIIQYSAKITNFGTTEMGIATISGLPEGLEISLSNYNLGSKIKNDDETCTKCALGITKNLIFELKNQPGYTFPDGIAFNLEFDFKKTHPVTITGYNMPYEHDVLHGGIYIINIPVEATIIIRTNNNTETVHLDAGVDYTISNVTGPLEINITPVE